MKVIGWVPFTTIAASLIGALAQAQETGHWTDTITLKGDLRLRYEAIDEDGEEDRERGRYRGRFGLSAQVDPEIKIVFQLATGGDNPVSTNQSFDDGFSTKDIGVDLAYVEWAINDNLRLLGGKVKNPLFRAGGNPLIWDSDLNPEGVALSYAAGMFFGTAAVFVAEERSSADDSLLFAAQGGVRVSFDDDGQLTAGAGYYDYSDTIGNEPFFDGSAKGNSVDAAGNLVFDYNEFELFVQYDMKVAEMPFMVFADFVRNSEADGNDTEFAFGAKLGKAKARGTWQTSWAYKDIEADAVIGTFTDSDFGGGGTDASGHILRAKYALRENLNLGASLFINEVEERCRQRTRLHATTDRPGIQVRLNRSTILDTVYLGWFSLMKMQTSDLTDHISRRFNQDLEDLRNSVLTMGGLVETQLASAISAIVTGDSELGLKVANDDYKVNNLEVNIDEECSRVLATRSPAASDLRLIVAIIKTITDLERIGDEAEKIGFLASKLAAMDRPADSYQGTQESGQSCAA